MKKVILTTKAPAPIGPYSQAIECNGMIYCSGQISINPETGEVFLGDVKEQAQMVMKNIKALLDEAGLKFENIVKTTIFLTDMKNFGVVNEVYGEYFKQSPPARSTVAVSGLPKGVSVEIEVLAAR